MHYLHHYLFPAIWIGYITYWWTMAANVKESVKTESALSRFTRAASIILAVVLLWLPRVPIPLFEIRFLPQSELYFWIGVAITAGGLSFSVWGRRHLGKNWSQAVTIKEDHKLIETGPYSIVRHPIYTGFLFGFVGTSIALGEIRGLIAVALVFVVLYHKLKLEEKWLREQFGKPYEIYSQRVSALIPFII
jgi:protein-S-isoprenylcysteine O-methyltransferase Ste14